jgi:hypothetical protein
MGFHEYTYVASQGNDDPGQREKQRRDGIDYRPFAIILAHDPVPEKYRRKCFRNEMELLMRLGISATGKKKQQDLKGVKYARLRISSPRRTLS